MGPPFFNFHPVTVLPHKEARQGLTSETPVPHDVLQLGKPTGQLQGGIQFTHTVCLKLRWQTW